MARTSCEEGRSTAYSVDLRWRMVFQREGMRLPYADIAKNLNVDESTVKRIVKIFQDTGNVTVTKKVYNNTNLPRKLTMVVQCNWYWNIPA